MDASSPKHRRALRSPDRLAREIADAGCYWIWGPPGAGKSTLARTATHASAPAVAWVSIDALDRDAPAFFSRVRSVIESAQERSMGALPVCTAAHLSALDAYSRLFWERVFADAPRGFTLVFDSIEPILAAPWTIAALRLMCETRPAHARIMITARTRPPGALSRQRANGALIQIGPDALRLQPAEIAASLARIDCVPDAQALERVTTLTRGWAAGVAALGLALRAGAAVEPHRAAESDWLIDYFVREVLDAEPAKVRHALLDIAFLPHVDRATVEAMGVDAAVLERVREWAGNGQFVDEAEPPGHVRGDERYVLHPLLATALRAPLRGERSEAAVRAQQQCTATALAANGMLEPAFDLLCDCGDAAAAAEMLDSLAASLHRGGRYDALRERAGRLAREQIRAYPKLCYWIGLAELFFDPAAGRPWLADAIEGCERNHDRETLLAALGFMIGSFFIEQSSTVPIEPWLEKLRAQSADFAALPAGARANVTVAAFSGMLLAAPDHPELQVWEERLHALLAEPIDAVARMRGALMLVKHYYYTGQYERIRPLRERIEPLARAPDLPAYAQLAWYLVRLPDCWSAGDTLDGQRELAAALSRATASGIHALDNHNRLHAVCALLLAGDLGAAERLLRTVQLGTLPSKHMEAWHLHLHRAWHALLRGDRARAFEYGSACLRDARTLGGVANEMFAQIAIAYSAADAEARRRAVAEIERLAGRARSDIGRFHARLLNAVELIDQGAHDAAQSGVIKAAVIEAAVIGAKHGYVHFHFGVPDVLARYCAAALEIEAARAFAQRLVRARRLPAPPGALHDPRWPRPVRVHALGRFDIFVNDTLLTAPGRAQRRPIELLQALIAFGADRVPVARLCDALWPELDGDAARQAFKVALHRLRRMLGAAGVIQIHNDLASLDPGLVWVDALALNAWLARSASPEGALRRDGPVPGPLFPGVDTPWALSARLDLERALAAKFHQPRRRVTH